MSNKELTSEATRLLDHAMALLDVIAVADFDGCYIHSPNMDGLVINEAANGIRVLVDLARDKIEEANYKKPKLVNPAKN